MFLGCLENDEQKLFFIMLAIVVAVAEGDVKDTFSNKIEVPSSDDLPDPGAWDYDRSLNDTSAGSSFIKAMVSEEEHRMLTLFAKEMEIPGGNFFDDNIDDWAKIFNAPLVLAINHFKNDKDVKKKVIELLVAHDLEIGDQKVIDNLTMYTDEVRKDVLERVLTILFSSDMDKPSLSTSQSRAIVFELAAIGYADRRFEGNEISVVAKINSMLGLDKEYLEEACEIISRITEAASEAYDLIQE